MVCCSYDVIFETEACRERLQRVCPAVDPVLKGKVSNERESIDGNSVQLQRRHVRMRTIHLCERIKKLYSNINPRSWVSLSEANRGREFCIKDAGQCMREREFKIAKRV